MTGTLGRGPDTSGQARREGRVGRAVGASPPGGARQDASRDDRARGDVRRVVSGPVPSVLAMLIDCDTCTARPRACGDCVVTHLLSVRPSTVPLEPPSVRRTTDRVRWPALGAAALALAIGLVWPLGLPVGLLVVLDLMLVTLVAVQSAGGLRAEPASGAGPV